MQESIKYQNYSMLEKLDTKILGRKYIEFNQIDSTQKEIWRKIKSNEIENGMLIRANTQTGGIGTHGRTWISTKNNITFSFYYELNCNVNKIEGLTVEIAEIILEILKQEYQINLQIKLPNDIYYNGKKSGGILTETKIVGDTVKYVVVGIGLNNSQIEFDDELKDIATSINKEFGIEIDGGRFIGMFCNMFEKLILTHLGTDSKCVKEKKEN